MWRRPKTKPHRRPCDLLLGDEQAFLAERVETLRKPFREIRPVLHQVEDFRGRELLREHECLKQFPVSVN
jgi:hypothetical protein